MKRNFLAIIGIVVIVVVAAAAVLLMQPSAKVDVKKMKVAVIYVTPLEESWNQTMHVPMTKVANEKGFTYSYNESVSDADVERVIREYVSKGYNIISPHSWSYTKVTESIYKEFPDTFFLYNGGEIVDKNLGQHVLAYYEQLYLLGMLMGGMTKTNKVGTVAAFPGLETSREMNAMKAGIAAVNPTAAANWREVFIESWFDPAKAKEAAKALINQGYDFLFAERDGVIDACKEAGVLAVGQLGDFNAAAPNTVVSGTMWDLAPLLRTVVSRYTEGTLTGKYMYYGLKEEGGIMAPYHGFETKIPSDLKAKVDQAKADLIAGKDLFKVTPAYPEALRKDVEPQRYASMLCG